MFTLMQCTHNVVTIVKFQALQNHTEMDGLYGAGEKIVRNNSFGTYFPLQFLCTSNTYLCILLIFPGLNHWANVVTAQKATIHQVTTMLATSKNVLFPDHNHLLTMVLMTQHFDYRPSTTWCIVAFCAVKLPV